MLRRSGRTNIILENVIQSGFNCFFVQNRKSYDNLLSLPALRSRRTNIDRGDIVVNGVQIIDPISLASIQFIRGSKNKLIVFDHDVAEKQQITERDHHGLMLAHQYNKIFYERREFYQKTPIYEYEEYL